uniref:Tidi1 n=2 Tax=Dunaliella TaxID=3044 RepID=A0AC62AEK9_DUNTE|nr:chloroplast Tidi [Dunaliella salina]
MPPLRPSPKETALVAKPRTSILIKPFKITRLHAHEGASADSSPGPAPPKEQQEQPPKEQVAPPPAAAQAAAEPTQPQAASQAPPAPEPKKGSAFKGYVQQNFVQPGRTLQQQAGRKIYPGSDERALSYLTGSLPGDFGWDPLHLADTNDQDRLNNAMSMEWLSYAEVIHGRWAMLGAAGALSPEVLGKAGVIPKETGLTWFQAGGLDSSSNLIAVPFTGPIPFQYWTDQYTLLFTMLVAMGFAETRRWQEYKEPGSVQKQFFLGLEKLTPPSQQPAYPGGGFFNFAGLGAKDEKQMFELKVKEIRNGRLAMLAFLGFMVQAEVTHVGPFQNLLDHINSPGAQNLLSRLTN